MKSRREMLKWLGGLAAVVPFAGRLLAGPRVTTVKTDQPDDSWPTAFLRVGPDTTGEVRTVRLHGVTRHDVPGRPGCRLTARVAVFPDKALVGVLIYRNVPTGPLLEAELVVPGSDGETVYRSGGIVINRLWVAGERAGRDEIECHNVEFLVRTWDRTSLVFRDFDFASA